jgi:hypothetical protein
VRAPEDGDDAFVELEQRINCGVDRDDHAIGKELWPQYPIALLK